jgi:hypothetical protein
MILSSSDPLSVGRKEGKKFGDGREQVLNCQFWVCSAPGRLNLNEITYYKGHG